MDDISLLALLDKMPGMVYRCCHDVRRTMLFVSAGCMSLSGYLPADLLRDEGVAYGDLILPEDRAAVQQAIDSALCENRSYTCTYRLITADGQRRWVWETGRGILDSHGGTLVLEGFVTDATKQVVAVQHLEQRLSDRTRKLSALYDILELASKPVALSVVINKSLQRVLSATQGQAGFIHLRDKTGKALQLVACQNLPPILEDKLSHVSTKEGLAAWVLRNQRPVLIPDLSQDPRADFHSPESGLIVCAAVPIATRERVFGALSVLGNESGQFAEEEIELLVSIGEQLAVAIENARLRKHSERLLLVQERNRLARELHDSVTQSLYSLTLFAEVGRRMAEAGKYQEATEYFSQIGDSGQQALKEMRLLVHNLRPSILSRDGLVRALQYRLNSVEGRAGVTHAIEIDERIILSPGLENTVYQITQEALNNALKHAMATEVVVRLKNAGGQKIVLEIEDNGRGFDLDSAAESDGMGLSNMQERAEMFDGELSIKSAPGRGTVVTARLKISPRRSRQPDEFDVEELI